MSEEKQTKVDRSVQKGLRWVLALFLMATLVLAVMLVLVLAQTTANHDLYTPYFIWLKGINIAVASLLCASLLWGAFRLIARFRQKRFGSQLLLKLAAIFALVGIFPGVLVYAVSYQFVSKSIETWFDVKVDGALSAGLKLGQVSYEQQAKDLALNTKNIAADISATVEGLLPLQLERMRQQYQLESVVLMNMDGEVLSASGKEGFRLKADKMTTFQRTELLQEGVIYSIEDIEGAAAPRLWAIAIAPYSSLDLTHEVRVLRVTTSMPQVIASNARMVQEAYQEYQERALGREGLRQMYIRTLTLALFLAVFSALVLAVILGQQLMRPILILVEGVQQVKEGDLSPKKRVHTRDELGGLTHAFADMTNQLRQANQMANEGMRQVADARAHLQTILDNLTTGVIELDGIGHIQMINPGAKRILRHEETLKEGKKLEDFKALEKFASRTEECFSVLPEDGSTHWQETFELEGLAPNENVTIVARGVWVSGTIKLIVLDDISDIISAQRSMAWGEVARRLAHEIKNPLTPIQLSAERIEYRFADKLNEEDQRVMRHSVGMIVEQVDAMKRLVDEFREYARLPVAELTPLDLNVVVRDIMQLYIGASLPDVEIALDLAPELPLIQGDASQMRQVMHNLVQNAMDGVLEQPHKHIVIKTDYRESKQEVKQAGRVCLTIEDNGIGFPDKMLKRAFEPYMTTKPKGTGLGLAVVKKIVGEHGARVDLSNRTDADGKIQGAQVQLSFPVAPTTQALSVEEKLFV